MVKRIHAVKIDKKPGTVKNIIPTIDPPAEIKQMRLCDCWCNALTTQLEGRIILNVYGDNACDCE